MAACLVLGDLYMDLYGLSMTTAGALVTAFTFTTGLSRIPGGALADRFGARPLLRASFPAIALMLAPIVFGLSAPVVVLSTVVCGILLGGAMSATFKAIPSAFPRSVGAVGGLVGAIGGLGGFFLPLMGGWTREATGTPTAMVWPLMGIALAGAAAAWLHRPQAEPAQPVLSLESK